MIPQPVMNALLGAVSDPKGHPNREQIEEALTQLAEAAVAVCRPLRAGMHDRFLMAFSMAWERDLPRQGEEE